VDQGLQKILSDAKAPLVLAGVDYLFPIYREANSYPDIMREGIAGNPEGMRPEELRKAAWQIVKPYFLRARQEAVDRYTHAAGSSIASNDVKAIASAAYQGRIELLLLALGIQRWGVLDTEALSVQLHEQRNPGDEDLLDFAAAHTLLNGGTVYALEPGEIPEGACAAAIFRY
jgi:hypothetical protein